MQNVPAFNRDGSSYAAPEILSNRTVFECVCRMTRPMQTEPIAYTYTHSQLQASFYATRKTRPKIQGEGSTYLWPFKIISHIIFTPSEWLVWRAGG